MIVKSSLRMLHIHVHAARNQIQSNWLAMKMNWLYSIDASLYQTIWVYATNAINANGRTKACPKVIPPTNWCSQTMRMSISSPLQTTCLLDQRHWPSKLPFLLIPLTSSLSLTQLHFISHPRHPLLLLPGNKNHFSGNELHVQLEHWMHVHIVYTH